jgi:hypothetical protein
MHNKPVYLAEVTIDRLLFTFANALDGRCLDRLSFVLARLRCLG